MADTETIKGLINNLLTYNPETGDLYWKPRPKELFADLGRRSPEHAAANWNSRHAGRKAFTAVGANGYRVGRILGTTFLAHRVIMCLMTGCWPKNDVDHVNGDRLDNRWENLRHATKAQNNRNGKSYGTTSEYVGVYWNRHLGGYVASVYHNGKRHYCGFSKTDPKSLALRRDRKAKELFGEFVRLNFEGVVQ